MSEQSNTPTLSRFSASILLYFIVTALISLLLGVVLNALGKLPSILLTIVGAINSSLGIISFLWGAIAEKSFPKGIWKNANQPLAIIVSIISVFVLTLFALGISSKPTCASLGTCSPEAATAIAQSTVQANATASAIAQAQIGATATAQANATASAIAQAQIEATATAQAQVDARATIVAQNPNPYPPYTGTLVLYDTLTDSNNPNKWSEGTSPNGGTCKFTDGAYQVLQPQINFTYCVADSYNFVNFTYQVDMKILGGDCGGIIFRVDRQANNFYLFEVCRWGGCQFALYLNNKIINNELRRDFDCTKNINTDPNKKNTLAVVAKDNNFTLYLNGGYINFTDKNKNLTGGTIGVFARRYYDYPTNVEFINAKLWSQ